MDVFIIFGAIAYIALCVIPAGMAMKRGRGKGNWFGLSLLFTPILGTLLLVYLGETAERRERRALREKEWPRM